MVFGDGPGYFVARQGGTACQGLREPGRRTFTLDVIPIRKLYDLYVEPSLETAIKVGQYAE